MVGSSTRAAFLGSGYVSGLGDSARPHRPARPVTAPPLGRVRFTTHRGEPAEAILDVGGIWRCPQLPVLDRVLNALFAPVGDDADVAFGQPELIGVATWIKGEVRSEPHLG